MALWEQPLPEPLRSSFRLLPDAQTKRAHDFSATEHLAPDAVVAYADGELPMTPYQRASAHLAQCAMCAGDVAAQREARAALRAAPKPCASAALLGMLAGIADGPGDNPDSRPAPAGRALSIDRSGLLSLEPGRRWLRGNRRR